MMEWWILNAANSKQVSGELNALSLGMHCGSRGEKGVSQVLEIVSKVSGQGEYTDVLGGVFLIGQRHLGRISPRQQSA
jgi:hypothetical protein